MESGMLLKSGSGRSLHAWRGKWSACRGQRDGALFQAKPKPGIVPKVLEKNVLQLTCGLFVGFLFVTQSVSLAAHSLWKSLQTQCFSLPWCIFPVSFIMSQPVHLCSVDWLLDVCFTDPAWCTTSLPRCQSHWSISTHTSCHDTPPPIWLFMLLFISTDKSRFCGVSRQFRWNCTLSLMSSLLSLLAMPETSAAKNKTCFWCFSSYRTFVFGGLQAEMLLSFTAIVNSSLYPRQCRFRGHLVLLHMLFGS